MKALPTEMLTNTDPNSAIDLDSGWDFFTNFDSSFQQKSTNFSRNQTKWHTVNQHLTPDVFRGIWGVLFFPWKNSYLKGGNEASQISPKMCWSKPG